MPIALPGPDAVPAGPQRDLVVRLHDLYGQAGKPATRIVSRKIKVEQSTKLETVSHETINSVLRGKSVPSWAKLRSIIVVFCQLSDQQVDIRRQLAEFNALWVRAGTPQAAPAPPDEPDLRPRLPSRPFPQSLPAIEPGPAGFAQPPSAEVAGSGVHSALPRRSPLFTGRERALDQIADRLRRSPETPLILYGPIGAGKTELAAEYVRHHRGAYAITWWIQADDVEGARDSLLRLADNLGLSAAGGIRPSFDQLFDLLARSGPYLLVFDGVVSGDIRTLIRTRGGNVIVTTRNAGWAQESQHDEWEIPDLDESESAQLLRKHDPRITPSDVALLIGAVGRSPLGLVEVCRLAPEPGSSWADVAARLANPVDLMLTGPEGGTCESVEALRSIVRDRLSGDADLLPLVTLLLGFGPSPVWLWMLQAGAGGDVSAGVRRLLGDSNRLRRALHVLVGIGLARRHAQGEWIEIPAIVWLVLRELIPAAQTEINRCDVVEILVLADPGQPEDRRTSARHHAITPHVRPAALVEWFRPAAYRTVHHQIRFLFLVGNLRAAQRLGRDAEAALVRQQVLAPTDELALQIRRDLANALRADGGYAEAYRLTEEAMTLIAADPAYLPDHAIALDLARSRGHDLRIAGRYREAYELDEVTHLRHTSIFPEDDVRRLASRYNLSVSRRFLGRFREAAEADRDDLDRLRGARPGADRRQSRLTNALAEDLCGLGRYEDLVDLLAPVVAGETGRELQRARRVTGIAFRRLGHFVPAVEQLGICYQACMTQLGARHELTLAACLSFGNALRELGQFETALHYCDQAAEGYVAALGGGNPLVQVARVNTAAVHLARGDAERAGAVLGVAHAALAEQLGDRHPFTVLAAVNRASAAATIDPRSAWSWSGPAYEKARDVFGADHLDTLLAAAGFAADRAAGNAPDGLAPSCDQVLSSLRRRFGATHASVAAVAAGTRVAVDVELPSA